MHTSNYLRMGGLPAILTYVIIPAPTKKTKENIKMKKKKKKGCFRCKVRRLPPRRRKKKCVARQRRTEVTCYGMLARRGANFAVCRGGIRPAINEGMARHPNFHLVRWKWAGGERKRARQAALSCWRQSHRWSSIDAGWPRACTCRSLPSTCK